MSQCAQPLCKTGSPRLEAELEQRRMLAYRGRGKFRENTEDAGDELQEKEVACSGIRVLCQHDASPAFEVPESASTQNRSYLRTSGNQQTESVGFLVLASSVAQRLVA
eukprot:2823149-Amphidinium_carterae.1